jgi:hypothetical protein
MTGDHQALLAAAFVVLAAIAAPLLFIERFKRKTQRRQ